MTEILYDWVRALAGAGVLCCAAQLLCPEGRVHSVLRVVCGTVMALALLSPVASLDFEAYAEGMALYREEASQITERADAAEKTLLRTVIEADCAAYISDKARQAGVSLTSVSVEVKWGDADCWVPYAAVMVSDTDTAQERLEPWIEAELGIPAERQVWSME